MDQSMERSSIGYIDGSIEQSMIPSMDPSNRQWISPSMDPSTERYISGFIDGFNGSIDPSPSMDPSMDHRTVELVTSKDVSIAINICIGGEIGR